MFSQQETAAAKPSLSVMVRPATSNPAQSHWQSGVYTVWNKVHIPAGFQLCVCGHKCGYNSNTVNVIYGLNKAEELLNVRPSGCNPGDTNSSLFYFSVCCLCVSRKHSPSMEMKENNLKLWFGLQGRTPQMLHAINKIMFLGHFFIVGTSQKNQSSGNWLTLNGAQPSQVYKTLDITSSSGLQGETWSVLKGLMGSSHCETIWLILLTKWRISHCKDIVVM